MSSFNTLRDLYKQHGLHNFPAIVTQHFRNALASEQIPELDLHNPPASFPDGSLVLFRAMIQDTSLPSTLYLATTADGHCGGWGIPEVTSPDQDVDYSNLREASTFWAVSIPGLSAWCSSNESQSPPLDLHQPIQPHKFPLPGVNHIGVQVKIYDQNLSKDLRATDLVSFVGMLDSEPLQSGFDLPESIHVPTLHVLFSTPIPITIVPRLFPEPSLLPKVNALREEVITWIAEEGLAGDRIAAEWVLLCTIARVRSRQPPILPLSLTISGFPSNPENSQATPALYRVLSHLFPIVTLYPLVLDALNNTPFQPKSKDEDLHSGLLQQPKGAILLLTEGAVKEGGILSEGVMSIRSVQQMLKHQTLEYTFPFSGFEFETDVNVVVTTEGRQSIVFETDINIPFRPAISEGVTNELYKTVAVPSEEKLLLFRQLVGGSKIGDVTVTKAFGKYIEDDFVRERALNSEKTNGTTGLASFSI
ncbi:hypothetical protein M413DRAFT_92981 [Hebeloma cylindrosporum]|uniref:Mini-chromosome maintenance complex-binding protein n=1 Tax=Hebeloma cylindrosporum TaxID=76867 RepID=A0A0C2Z799_HEBCY|nr:hypothetical protein M413DRAFT_92981 [Hebeloma cylindrosporum h7]